MHKLRTWKHKQRLGGIDIDHQKYHDQVIEKSIEFDQEAQEATATKVHVKEGNEAKTGPTTQILGRDYGNENTTVYNSKTGQVENQKSKKAKTFGGVLLGALALKYFGVV